MQIRDNRPRLSPLWILVCLVLISTNSISQTPKEQLDPKKTVSQTKEEKAYQNLQRARHLLLMKGDVKALDDTEMRCILRFEIVKFIFDNDVLPEFDSAEAMSTEFFEDMAKNSEQISAGNAERWGNMLLPILRKKSSDLAKKLEAKYMSKADTSVADLFDLQGGAKPSDIADRTIAKIARGEVSDYVHTIHDDIRPTDPASADRILVALLGFFEKMPDISRFAPLLDSIRANYTRPTAPVELKTRYLQFLVNLARTQITLTDEGQFARFVLRTLKDALPKIQETIPGLFNEAQSIFIVLDTRINKNNREREEAYARIEASDDKLQQIIAEAEATNDKKLKDSLWAWAARLALEKKKLKLAVDLAMNGEVNLDNIKDGRDRFICVDALEAILKERDFELAEYATKRIEVDTRRGVAMFKIAKALVDVKDHTQALEKLTDALKLFEKSDPSVDSVYHLIGAIPTALDIERSKGFDVAGQALKMANRLPTPNPEDKVGTPARSKYVGNVLLPIAFYFTDAFKALALSDVDLASSLVQDIQSKSWRLVAEIVVETERKYPMPPKTKTPELNATH